MVAHGLPIVPLSLYGYLLVALFVATVTDLRQRRIPNIVTLSTIVLALLVYSMHAGLPGLLFSLKGLGLGFALLLLPHLLGGIGAGDVKLMAAVGAVLGIDHTFFAFLIIAVFGGITALAMLTVRGEMWATLRRIAISCYAFCSGAGLAVFKVDRPTLRQKGIPYGAVIAVGTITFFVYQLTIGRDLPGLVP